MENSVVIPSITYDTRQKEYSIGCENPTFCSYTISKGFILGEVSSHEGENCDSEVNPLLDVIYEIERRRKLPPKTGTSSPPEDVKANIASTEVDPKRFVDESIPPPHASAAPGEEDESEIENNDFKTTPEPQLPFSSLHRINKLDAKHSASDAKGRSRF